MSITASPALPIPAQSAMTVTIWMETHAHLAINLIASNATSPIVPPASTDTSWPQKMIFAVNVQRCAKHAPGHLSLSALAATKITIFQLMEVANPVPRDAKCAPTKTTAVSAMWDTCQLQLITPNVKHAFPTATTVPRTLKSVQSAAQEILFPPTTLASIVTMLSLAVSTVVVIGHAPNAAVE